MWWWALVAGMGMGGGLSWWVDDPAQVLIGSLVVIALSGAMRLVSGLMLSWEHRQARRGREAMERLDRIAGLSIYQLPDPDEAEAAKALAWKMVQADKNGIDAIRADAEARWPKEN